MDLGKFWEVLSNFKLDEDRFLNKENFVLAASFSEIDKENKLDEHEYVYFCKYDDTPFAMTLVKAKNFISSGYVAFEDFMPMEELDLEGVNEVEYTVYFYFSSEYTESLKQLCEKLIKDIFVTVKSKSKVSLVSSGIAGLELIDFKVTNPEIDFDLNYNDDFKDIDRIIKNKLGSKNSKGLVLLHGDPGTGKTMYLRHLICSLEKNHIIYLPPAMISEIASPAFTGFIAEFPDSVLIIEDAEMVIKKRGDYGSSENAVANLLNLSDGLLSDTFNIQVIATFNDDIDKIDPALQRKGRLIAKYEFKPLEVEKARKLAEKLNKQIDINEPVTLSQIYNADEKDFSTKPKKRVVGF
jgi:SpoVK/Ycf46/Vps4 family AAA+-type ATPase